MRLPKLATGFVAAWSLICSPLWGQDEAAKTVHQIPEANLELAVEMMSNIILKMVEKAELTDDQRQQVQIVVDDGVKELVYARHELDSFFTKEQQKVFNGAMKLARNAKYSDDKAREYAFKKLNLPKDELDRYTELEEHANASTMELNNQILALLTEEQRAKVPILLSPEVPLSEFRLKLPNLKTSEDADQVVQAVKTIARADKIDANAAEQTLTFKAPNNTPLKKKIDEFLESGKDVFKDWSIVTEAQPAPNDSK